MTFTAIETIMIALASMCVGGFFGALALALCVAARRKE